MVAAVYLENGSTSQDVAEMADAGSLVCFHRPESAEKSGPLCLELRQKQKLTQSGMKLTVLRSTSRAVPNMEQPSLLSPTVHHSKPLCATCLIWVASLPPPN